ncbi:hypothetical protein IFM89_027760 [Coptis chinensis]|uniref:Uncharacterized protein n=1 Tax=Coptis chinensis TaxID=261450 RepID=A0A835I246_9MAGN|nr:hypothetical protein IFM89_027760 [Coptis chinensis]
MKAVSFMYVRPPGYNAESVKAAELEDERRRTDGVCYPQPFTDGHRAPSSMLAEEKKKLRPKDIFGHALPREEEFEVLKNDPRLETGLTARSKPFGVEVRNVKCLRFGNFGHQSGDRECPLKDAIDRPPSKTESTSRNAFKLHPVTKTRCLNNELKKCERACASSQPTTCGSDQPIACGSDQPTACETSGNVHTTTKDNGLICSPQSVRGAGRPPFKRKTSKIEQVVKKLQEKKKKEGKREQVTKMNQGNKKKGTSTIEKTINDLDLEKDPIGGSEVMESGETQESIPLKDTIGGEELMEFGGRI